MGDCAVKSLLIDGAIKFILLLVMVGRVVSPSDTAAPSDKEEYRAADLPQHDNE
jgi:hypothetical protein